ncbi:hypothetical protein QUF63_07570 [Anaerolineales bacterium HSG25]|nr:hypothetical protein [Anaerolineales bacterium HSG25]
MMSTNPTIETALHQHSIRMLNRQLEIRFALSVDMVKGISDKLQKLTLSELEVLFVELFKLKTVQQLNGWIQKRLESVDDAEYQFELELMQLGLLKERPDKPYQTDFSPIDVTGQPLSEQIIAERR